MMKAIQTSLPDVVILEPRVFGDARGFFFESFSNARFAELTGCDVSFVQDNHSRSARGVLRGLHYQVEPAAQAKLVRVSRGSVFDVALDIRRSSPTFGQWTGLVLSAEGWNQLLVPAGFAHGFLALEDGSEVQYKVSAPYSPQHDRGIRPDDPAIGIEWPIARDSWLLSAKDQSAPLLAEAELFG